MTVDDEVLECMLSAMRSTSPWDDPKAPHIAGLQAVFDKYVAPLEADCKRFESAYLELRDQTAPSVRLLAPGAKQYDGTFSGPGAPTPWRARLRVWHDGNGEVLRVDVIQGRYDAIREEAETLAIVPALQGIPTEAIERVLREVRK